MSTAKGAAQAKVFSNDNVEIITIGSVPKKLLKITPTNLFDALIYPLKPSDFFDRIFQKKALVIKNTDKA